MANPLNVYEDTVTPLKTAAGVDMDDELNNDLHEEAELDPANWRARRDAELRAEEAQNESRGAEQRRASERGRRPPRLPPRRARACSRACRSATRRMPSASSRPSGSAT